MTLPSDGVRFFPFEIIFLTSCHNTEKLLQAVGALNRALVIKSEHPALHIRLVDLKLRASAFPQQPPAPIGTIFVESVAKLTPDDITLETFNSQYLQRNSSDPEALLAVAQVLKMLNTPLAEIESTVFGILGEDVDLDIKVRGLIPIDELRPIHAISIDSIVSRRLPYIGQVFSC